MKERELEQILKQGKKELLESLRSIAGRRVVNAIASIPRENFIDHSMQHLAYEDIPLPIPGYNPNVITISSPKIVAQMTDLLDPRPTDKVLEIGTGTGYQAAVLSKLSGRVISVDVFSDLSSVTKRRLEKLGIDNVDVVVADGSIPFTKVKAFEKIIVTASMFPSPYSPIFSMLNEGGVCVAPIGGIEGSESSCTIIRIRREGNRYIIDKKLPGFVFVPMLGMAGWGSHYKMIIEQMYSTFYGEESKGWLEK